MPDSLTERKTMKQHSILSLVPWLRSSERKNFVYSFLPFGWLANLGRLAGLALLLAGPHVHGSVTRYWLGTAGNKWSTPANWSPAGSPQNGDQLVFTNRVSSYITNDLNNLSVDSLSFHLSFTVNGNALMIRGGIYYFGTSGLMTLNNASLTLGSASPFTAVSPTSIL